MRLTASVTLAQAGAAYGGMLAGTLTLVRLPGWGFEKLFIWQAKAYHRLKTVQ